MMTAQFPLGRVTDAQLQQLSEVLWSWTICAECMNGKTCNFTDCSWLRSPILDRYFKFYKLATSNYEGDLESGQVPGVTSHEKLSNIIRKLKANPELTKEKLLEVIFTDRPIRQDQERALNLAVQVAMMINCAASRQSSILLEYGSHQASWNKDVTLSQFMCNAFAQNNHSSIDDIKGDLRAVKLKRHAGLSFQPTNDLRNHLRLDKKTAIVEIFHHTAFLKEQLRITKDLNKPLSIPDLIRLGAHPRALALEVLDSIQKILFPLTDNESKNLLLSLTSSCNFDPDILEYHSFSIRRDDEQLVSYRYFGDRLVDLHEELVNPTPRGFQKWFERNSSARFVMMATIAGVLFAILLGLLSLGVGGLQAYIGYMAWKYPVRSSALT